MIDLVREDLLNQSDCPASPSTGSFLHDVLEGLSRAQKELPCKYFYDQRGSQLFDEICLLDEYYPTRTELAIMKAGSQEMVARLKPGSLLVEYGSGSSVKTRCLLDNARQLHGYVPVDISEEHLEATAQQLRAAYPQTSIWPLAADFTQTVVLPKAARQASRIVVYFPGSTIGNFQPDEAVACLKKIAALVGTGGGLLIGVDLVKDENTLWAAYNDRRGVTAEFNRNLLRRINRELDGKFPLHRFAHQARWVAEQKRIEMHLVSQQDQTVMLGERRIAFHAGESIRTEYSHKYTLASFEQLARQAGWQVDRAWTDDQQFFSVQSLTVQA